MIIILTYQDLLEVGENEYNLTEFIRRVINTHKSSELYRIAKDGWNYYRHRNTTITEYQKLLYTVTGKAIPDTISPNYKMASKFFPRFVTQENQYLLGNGATFENEDTKERLGKDFDIQIQKAGKYALIGGVSFGFWNLDHLEVFKVTEFAPLYDEETGALRAGVRFWQIDDSKPLRATLYEEDGYTDYIWNTRDGDIYVERLHDKAPYILAVASSESDGMEIVDGSNYEGFPIVPLWANDSHQSELVGLKEQIDCYDLIKSGFADSVDEASFIYWTINNAGGMDNVDLAEFVDRVKTIHAAITDDNVKAEPHQIEAPYQSREALLDRLRVDLYEDAMALDTKSIVGGSNTATQIKANYEPLDDKCDDYEYQVKNFINGILELVGVEDYVTKKILDIFGDSDQAEAILKQMDADSYNVYNDNEEEQLDDGQRA